MTPPPQADTSPQPRWRRWLAVYRYTPMAVGLVWQTNRRLLVSLGVLTVVAGLIPASIAWIGQRIVDAVLTAADSGLVADRDTAMMWIVAELVLVLAMAAAQRGLEMINFLLRAELGHTVNVMILRKALELDLAQFEDAETYDKMTRARRDASSRPLSLVRRTFGLLQNFLAISTFGALLWAFSPWAVMLLAAAAVPAFVAETKFAGEAFRLFSWRSPEKRKQAYLEVVVAREDFAKEVKLQRIGPRLVDEYDAIYQQLYDEDRSLTLRRAFWGFALGVLSTLALYGAYGWIGLAAVAGTITLGQMTMYLMLFKQGQSAFSAILQSVAGAWEDNLYLSNLYEFLDEPVPRPGGAALEGPSPSDGIRFEHVTFTYPGATEPAVTDLSLHVPPGRKLALVGHNGSGKTTLIKLLTRLYTPQSGTITLDGLPLQDWDEDTLRKRIGVVFQDFVRYQFTVGENIGAGDVDRYADEDGWAEAAKKGMAQPFIDELPETYGTQLGKWFPGGRELSGGQWQKVALSRAFMHEGADVLVLDEPTSAMDAEAEAEIFERVRSLTDNQLAILISHRFSTVRMADEIVVLEGGKIIEQGDHEGLMEREGTYAHLFSLQAEGYR